MDLSAVLLARVIGFVETSDLNPRGKASFPQIVSLLVQRFAFQKYPTAITDFDEQKGVEFAMGTDGEKAIDKLTIWHNGIGVDLRTSTEDAKDLIHSTLSWLVEEAGITYEPRMINRWAYLSQLTYYSTADFDSLNKAMQRMAATVSSELTRLHNIPFQFNTAGFSLSFDRFMKEMPVANVTLQRRIGSPFSDNKYFSEAPLATETHIQVLTQFEADLLAR